MGFIIMAQNKCEHSHHQNIEQPDSGARLIDVVCGMKVTEQSPHHLTHKGNAFYFCSSKCMRAFEGDPEKFMDPQSAREPAIEQVEPGTLYTCPMHPEIEQEDRKSTRLNSSHVASSYAVFCLKRRTRAT